jgi:hypothetical protein
VGITFVHRSSPSERLIQPCAPLRPQDVISPGVRGMHPMPPGLYSDLPPFPPLSSAAGRDGSVAPGVPAGPADAATGAADAAADAAAGVLGILAAGVWGGGGGDGGGKSMSEVLHPLLAGPLAAHMSAVHWMDTVLAAPPPPPLPRALPHRSASSSGTRPGNLPPVHATSGCAGGEEGWKDKGMKGRSRRGGVGGFDEKIDIGRKEEGRGECE